MNQIKNKHGARMRATPMAAAVALAIVVGIPAHAQQAAAPQPALETVVVSANKRVEKLENVASTISVINEAVIERTISARSKTWWPTRRR